MSNAKLLRNVLEIKQLLDVEMQKVAKEREERELEERKKGVVQKHKFEVGDTVKIVNGVFVNFLGTVEEIFHDKGRLSVRVSIFGRDTRVDDLEFWQVERGTSEEEQ